MKTITAIYENGLFRPTEPVELPEHAEVKIVLQAEASGEKPSETEHRNRVEAILSERFDSGQGDLAARHNEHQP